MELSDIISFHCYQPVHDVVGIIEALKEDYDRPIINSEWLNRILRKWMHDLYHFNGYPYDKTEIELIQQLSKMADEKFEVKKHK